MPASREVSDLELKTSDATAPWHWEGNVQSTLVGWLVQNGYRILRVADTTSREQGKDIVALDRDGREHWVEVKGYRLKHANNQARVSFAEAVLAAIIARSESPQVRFAIGLPEGFETFRALAARIMWLRESMPLSIFWVSESGQVRSE